MNARGLTLIEVMVAVTIAAFIMALLGGSLGRQMAAQETINNFTERENSARMSMERMAREISMAYLSKHYNCNERRTVTLFKSDHGGEALTFTSFSHYKWVKDANESDQNEITYEVKNDPSLPNKKALFRREAPRINDDPGKTGKEYVLAHDIEKVGFEFYNPDTDSWDKDWDSTRLDQRFRLPLYVRIKLSVPWTDGKPRIFFTQSRIMLQDALAFGPNLCLN